MQLVGGVDALDMGDLALKRLARLLEAGPGEQQPRVRIVENERPFGRRKPPSDRRHHHADTCRAVEQCEIEIRILANPRDAIAFFQPRMDKRRGDARGPFFELGIGIGAIFLAQRRSRAAVSSPVVDELIEGQ